MKIEKTYRLPEIVQLLKPYGIARSTVFNKIKAALFPAPLKLGPRRTLWTESMLVKWLNENGIKAKMGNEK